MKRRVGRNDYRRYLWRSLVGLSLVLTLVVAAVTLALRLRGGAVLSIQTGSMAPTLRPGDAVISLRPATASLRCGDIITYRSPANPAITITHRLRRIEPANGWLTTQGDAASQPDPAFPPWLVVGRAVAVVPGFGKLLDDLHRPPGLILGIYLPAIGLVGAEGRHLMRATARLPTDGYRLRSV